MQCTTNHHHRVNRIRFTACQQLLWRYLTSMSVFLISDCMALSNLFNSNLQTIISSSSNYSKCLYKSYILKYHIRRLIKRMSLLDAHKFGWIFKENNK